jgi:hypothetical protein
MVWEAYSFVKGSLFVNSTCNTLIWLELLKI